MKAATAKRTAKTAKTAKIAKKIAIAIGAKLRKKDGFGVGRGGDRFGV